MALGQHLDQLTPGRTSGRALAVGSIGIAMLGATVFAAGHVAARSDVEPITPVTPRSPAGVDGMRCVVHLHGKSGGGGDPVVEDDVTYVFPNGNAEGWGGRQWLYFPEEQYESAREVVADTVAECDAILIGGFSNGAAFAAKLYCRGETFDGRLLGVVVDDPVPDEGVVDCSPAPGVRLTLYWTGALAATAQADWDCSLGDWTCEGGVTIGIDAYAEWLDTEVTASPFSDHQPYLDAPELDDWTLTEDATAGSEVVSTATPESTA